ncbi:hypothetical protein CL689_01095 [Candidatus Saccharibacteria bacterium]|nr:hypothetical protein [Candidatus Saccharibacteria bacterium]MBQ68646.1 hypothetical protein [Candidatus Saccharibacteria bacterium]
MVTEKISRALKWISKYLRSFWGVFFTCFILGVLLFVLLYGFDAINPKNVAWILNGQDLEQHYLGWEFYRRSEWSFPVGQITTLAYPYGVPINFTDSIPLVAIPLKLFTGMLPENFQYIGIWGAISFGLTAAFAGSLLRRFTTSTLVVLAGAVLLTVTPVLVARMFIHTALASVWLIFAAFTLIAYWRVIQSRGLWLQLLLWAVLCVMAILIHPYYVPMVGTALFVYLVITYRSVWRFLVGLLVPVVAALLAFWVSGGFSLQGDSALGTPNEYNLDLLAPFSSSSWSNLLPSLSSISGESMMFVGAGAVLAVVCALVLFIVRKDYRKLWSTVRRRPIVTILTGMTLVALVVLSVGTVIRVNGFELADLEWLPERVQATWGIFRASARLFWPIYFLVIIVSLCYMSYALRGRQKLLISLILLFTLVQFVDVSTSPAGRSITGVASRTQSVKSADEKKVISYLGKLTREDSNKSHLVYLGSMNTQEYFDLNEAALKYNLTLSSGYFSRSPQALIDQRVADLKQKLFAGEKLADDSIYVLDDPDLIRGAQQNPYYSQARVGKYTFLEEK